MMIIQSTSYDQLRQQRPAPPGVESILEECDAAIRARDASREQRASSESDSDEAEAMEEDPHSADHGHHSATAAATHAGVTASYCAAADGPDTCLQSGLGMRKILQDTVVVRKYIRLCLMLGTAIVHHQH